MIYIFIFSNNFFIFSSLGGNVVQCNFLRRGSKAILERAMLRSVTKLNSLHAPDSPAEPLAKKLLVENNEVSETRIVGVQQFESLSADAKLNKIYSTMVIFLFVKFTFLSFVLAHDHDRTSRVERYQKQSERNSRPFNPAAQSEVCSTPDSEIFCWCC